MIVSIALAVYDGGGLRHRAGDVIAVRPSGWEWGDMERKLYLIAEVDLGNVAVSWERISALLESPRWEGRVLVVDPTAPPVKLGKRRFALPLAAIEAEVPLDYGLLLDQNVDYQPLAGHVFALNTLRDTDLGQNFNATRLAAFLAALG